MFGLRAVLVAVPAYAVQRLFVHASGWAFGIGAAGVVPFLLRGEVRHASISAGIATASFCYWMAFHERRDFERKK
ncbi:MAG TPA: hypothetical protein VGI97_00590 [Gemmatimonadaceae bacterium]|jgi:hypothetical protein